MPKELETSIISKSYTNLKNNFYGIMLGIIASIFFALTSILVKYSYKYDASLFEILFFRMIIASLFIWSLIIIKGSFKKIISVDKKYIFLSGLGGIFGYYIAIGFSFKALQYINPGLERMVFYIFPIFVILLNTIINKQKISPREILVFFIIQIGAYFLLKNLIGDKNSIIGIILVVIGAFFWAFFVIINQKVCKEVGSLVYVVYSMTIATILIAIHFFIINGFQSINISKELLLIYCGLGIVCTFIPYIFRSESIRFIGGNRASLISISSPIITIVMSYFLLKEIMTWTQIFGTFIIIIALIYLESDIRMTENKKFKNLQILSKINISSEYKIFSSLVIFYFILCYLLVSFKFIELNTIKSFVIFSITSLVFLIMLCYWFYHFTIIPTINQLIISRLEAQKSEKIAINALKARTQFFANINHELRTPLISVLGFSKEIMLKNEKRKEQSETYKFAKTIKNSGEHLLGIVNNILDVSKMESGKMVLSKEQVLLLDSINFSLEVLNVKAQEKDLCLNFINKLNKDYLIKADSQKLKQIFLNLVSNSVKYTDKGKVEIILNKNKQGQLEVKIKDTGIGIKKTNLEKIFKEYMQTSDGIKRGQGTGLGLPLAKKLLELHDFGFSIKSTYKKGTEILITIPKKDIIKEVEVKKETEKKQTIIEQSKPLFPKKKILVIDDDLINLSIIERLLKRFISENIIKTSNGKDVFSIIQKEKPDLVFMDENLGMDKTGSEIIGELKTKPKYKQYKNIPVIMLTADTLSDDVERIMSTSKAEGFAGKPYRMEHITELIKKLLN